MTEAVLKIEPIGLPWETIDPFLFCVYHDDAYPKGNGAFGHRLRGELSQLNGAGRTYASAG